MFLDYNQNAKDRTVASAYSVRPLPDARVSMPLRWDEVADVVAEDFTLATVPGDLRRAGRRRRRDRRGRRVARGAARAVAPATRRRAWATPRGRRTTRSRPASRRASSRRGSAGPRASTSPAAARPAGRRRKSPRSARPRSRPATGTPACRPSGRARARRRPAAASRRSRSSRSREPRRRPRRSTGFERWKERHPEAAAALEPADVLVDGMRGRSSLWYRVRVNLIHVPEADRPAQEPLDPDYDPWEGYEWPDRAGQLERAPRKKPRPMSDAASREPRPGQDRAVFEKTSSGRLPTLRVRTFEIATNDRRGRCAGGRRGRSFATEALVTPELVDASSRCEPSGPSPTAVSTPATSAVASTVRAMLEPGSSSERPGLGDRAAAGSGSASFGRLFSEPTPADRADLRRAQRVARRLSAPSCPRSMPRSSCRSPDRTDQLREDEAAVIREFVTTWASVDPGGGADVAHRASGGRGRPAHSPRAGSTSGISDARPTPASQGAPTGPSGEPVDPPADPDAESDGPCLGSQSRVPRLAPRAPRRADASGSDHQCDRERTRGRRPDADGARAPAGGRVRRPGGLHLADGGPWRRSRGRVGRPPPGAGRGGRAGAMAGGSCKLLGDGVLLRFDATETAIRATASLVAEIDGRRAAASSRRDRRRSSRRP